MHWNPLRLLRPWVKWLLLLAAWTLIGLAFASQFNFTQARRGYIVSWGFAVTTAMADWYVCAVLSVPALWLARRHHFEAGTWRRSLAVHVAASAAFAVLWVALRVVVELLRSRDHLPVFYFGEMFHWTLARSFYFNVFVYWVIVGASHGMEYYRRYRERELRAIELEKLLAQSRLQALQAQLNPHFLFNTLNSVSSLMHRDVAAADRMIVRLSALLRHALENVDTQEQPLRDEIDFLRRYLEIEQVRFGARLQVEFDVPAEALALPVPTLLLQPLVENAIKHGIAPFKQPGRIVVQARRSDGRLALRVSDNGPGGAGKSTGGAGLGLANTRARLEHLYGEEAVFVAERQPQGGFEVRIEIPVREMAATREAPVGPESA